MNYNYLFLFIATGAVGLALLWMAWRSIIKDEEELVDRAKLPWKILVPGYVFFASIAVGLSITAGASWLGYFHYNPLILAWASFASLIPAWALVYLDLGGPHKAPSIITGFNKTSRIAWNVVFYTLMTLSIFWFLLQPSTLSALAIIVFPILLETNLGMAFATSKIPGWTPLKAAEAVAAAFTLAGALLLNWKVLTVSALALLLLDFWQTYHDYFEHPKLLRVMPKGWTALYYILLILAALIAPYNVLIAAVLAFVGVFLQKAVTAYWPQKARLMEGYYKRVFSSGKASFVSGGDILAIVSAFLIWIAAISFGLMFLG